MPVERIQSTLATHPVFSESFRAQAPWWGGDLQTMRSVFLPSPAGPKAKSERLFFKTLDGSGGRLVGTLDIPKTPVSGPLILLIHGLTGDQDSPYMRNTARVHLAERRSVLRLNLRGAGPSRPFADGFYYGGCVDDIRAVIEGLPQHLRRDGVFAVGFSLGGSVLLNVLGQNWARDMLVGAATVSAPLVPADAARHLMKPRNFVYHYNLVRCMKAEFLRHHNHLSSTEQTAIMAARSVYQLDEIITAPRNGYRDADDYYQQTAGIQFVDDFAVPTLLIHARNDPWIPAAPYLDLKGNRNTRVLVTNSGGHVGFHERGFSETRFDRAVNVFVSAICGEQTRDWN